VVQSILAAEVGYQDLALEYFREALYVDLHDLHNNATDGVHVASAGGVWSALVSGFGGMRDYSGELSFDPRLPAEWPSLEFPLQWRGSSLRVTITRGELRMRVLSGDPVSFTVRGAAHTASVGSDAVVLLAGQGPVRPGRPTLRQFADARREDGTLMSPTVPVTTTIPVLEVD
ncbi:MAG: glycoside hydrolase family 65 protein, partial [Microbacterium sp.]|jgi:alpha,alpha-trehalose phosphorylase|nr:glycoside hydrolase family 65 protein [Microbacterium sp.]